MKKLLGKLGMIHEKMILEKRYCICILAVKNLSKVEEEANKVKTKHKPNSILSTLRS